MKEEKISLRRKIKSWKIPHILKNRYVFSFFVFAIWLFFFDQNNVFLQLNRLHRLKEAKSKTAYYKEETVKTKALLDELLTSEKSLEKFAREKYFMKKPNEDIFVIVK